MSPIVVRIFPDEIGPLLRRLVEREDRLDRAGWHAGAAVDALVGMNIEHLGRGEHSFVLPRMNTVHGTDVHARGILCPDAWLADDVRHLNNDSPDVRSGPHGAVYAFSPPRRPLRGLHLDRPDRGGRNTRLFHLWTLAAPDG